MGTLRSRTSCATFVIESWRRQPAKKSFALYPSFPRKRESTSLLNFLLNLLLTSGPMRVAERRRDDRGSPVRMFEDELQTKPFAPRHRVRVLRTGRSSLRRDGHPVGATNLGRLFFGYFLLAKQKKVTSRRAAPGHTAGRDDKEKSPAHRTRRQAQGEQKSFTYATAFPPPPSNTPGQTLQEAPRRRQTPAPTPFPSHFQPKHRTSTGISSNYAGYNRSPFDSITVANTPAKTINTPPAQSCACMASPAR